jgi:hypothetical protein
MKAVKYTLMISALAFILISSLWLCERAERGWVPKILLDKGLSLPISASDGSPRVIARFQFDKAQTSDVLKWYKSRGFNIGADNSETYGFGPDGISFSIYNTNQAMVLVVREWKDF